MFQKFNIRPRRIVNHRVKTQHHASSGNPCSFEEESAIADDPERHCAIAPSTRSRKNLTPIQRMLIDPGGVIEEHCTGATLEMTVLQQSFFELGLRLAFYEKKGDEFQIFFSRLMGLRYPSDFIPTRPWGTYGDRKCDGYHSTSRTLFQCFAPNEIALSKTLNKMKEDFYGALAYQKSFWDRWIFVHNAAEGRLPADVIIQLKAFQNENRGITTEAWGFYALRSIALELNEIDLRLVLPTIPAATDFADLCLPDIKPIVDHLATGDTAKDVDVTAPPPRKLEHNRLSPAAARQLTLGMARSALLKQYFAGCPDKTYGDRVAALFRDTYQRLRCDNLQPDDILMQLFVFAAGPLHSGSLRRDAAIWTVLAYLFEHCEIFEATSAS